MFLTGSVCLPRCTPPVLGNVLGLYPSCVGQQHSLECTTVQCLGAQLASIIPHGVTSQKTVTFNNLSEVSGNITVCDDLQHVCVTLEQKWRTQKHATVFQHVTKIVITKWLSCTQWSSAYIPVRNRLNDVVPGWLVTARGEFRPRQTRQLPRAVDLKGRLLSCQSY